jgi:hypothetical protein
MLVCPWKQRHCPWDDAAVLYCIAKLLVYLPPFGADISFFQLEEILFS